MNKSILKPLIKEDLTFSQKFHNLKNKFERELRDEQYALDLRLDPEHAYKKRLCQIEYV